MPSQAMEDLIAAFRYRQIAQSQSGPADPARKSGQLRPCRLPSPSTARRIGKRGNRGWGSRPLARRPGSGRRPGAPFPARRRLRARVDPKRRRAGRPAGTGERNAGAIP